MLENHTYEVGVSWGQIRRYYLFLVVDVCDYSLADHSLLLDSDAPLLVVL